MDREARSADAQRGLHDDAFRQSRDDVLLDRAVHECPGEMGRRGRHRTRRARTQIVEVANLVQVVNRVDAVLEREND